MAQQLSGLVWLHDSFYLERHKMSFLDGAAGCFAVYLRERRDETVSAFSSAEAVGRFFGLRVLSGNPEAYKKEILAFSQKILHIFLYNMPPFGVIIESAPYLVQIRI